MCKVIPCYFVFIWKLHGLINRQVSFSLVLVQDTFLTICIVYISNINPKCFSLILSLIFYNDIILYFFFFTTSYIYLIMQGTQDVKFFSKPNCLTRLARFTLEAYCSVVSLWTLSTGFCLFTSLRLKISFPIQHNFDYFIYRYFPTKDLDFIYAQV